MALCLSAKATIYYVSKDGNDTTGNGTSWVLAELTIGAAMADTGVGDTIDVNSGTYAETVTVSTQRTLDGLDKTAIISHANNARGILTTSTTTIGNLTIILTNTGTSTQGIAAAGRSNVVIENDDITSGYVGISFNTVNTFTIGICNITGGSIGVGIILNTVTGNNAIEDSNITSGYIGISFNTIASPNSLTIRDSNITGPYRGLETSAVSGIYVRNCNISSGYDVIYAANSAIGVENSSLTADGTYPSSARSSGISFLNGSNITAKNCLITASRDGSSNQPTGGVDNVPSGAASKISLCYCIITASSGENEVGVVAGAFIGGNTIVGKAKIHNCPITTSSTGASSVYDLYCYAKGTAHIIESYYVPPKAKWGGAGIIAVTPLKGYWSKSSWGKSCRNFI